MKLSRKVAFATVFGGLMSASSMAYAETLSMFCPASEADICKAGVADWEAETGNTVNILSMPNDWDEAVPQYQQLLSAKSTDVDILYVDVVWLGILQRNLLDLSGKVDDATLDQHFAPVVGAANIKDRLVALPWYMDAGFMYYRKDLLEKYGEEEPKTWDDLTRIAAKIQEGERAAGQDDMWGYVWQGKSSESLTCDAIEWIASNGGGSIVEPDGTVSLDNPNAAEALTRAQGWIDTISPRGVLGYDEDASRAVFEQGNAVFHRNWPYVWGTSQSEGSKIVDKVGVMALPVGKEGQASSGCLGPIYLSVSKHSAHPDLAIDLLKHVTGPKVQKMRALEGAYNPSIGALYDDAEILEAVPFMNYAEEAFAGAVARPSGYTGTNYNRVSQVFFQGVHDILANDADVAAKLTEMAADIEPIKESR